MRPQQCAHPLLPSQRGTTHQPTPVAQPLQTECFPWPHTHRPQQAGWEMVGRLSAPRSNLALAGRLEVRPYTNTRCFSSRLMSAYPRHKLSPTYTEGSQAPFPGSTQALLTHSRMGLGVQKSVTPQSGIHGEKVKSKPAAPGNRPVLHLINSHHPLTLLNQQSLIKNFLCVRRETDIPYAQKM